LLYFHKKIITNVRNKQLYLSLVAGFFSLGAKFPSLQVTDKHKPFRQLQDDQY